jgi:cell division FtsZ-interacting protein ZapD
MRAHYRKIKLQTRPYYGVHDEQQLELLKELPGRQKDLMEFCLASGCDLEELNTFFREVDAESTPIWPG